MKSDKETNFTIQWVRADMVFYTHGHGNTEKEKPNQTGSGKAFWRCLWSVCLCMSLFASPPIYPTMLQSIFHLSNSPMSICLLTSYPSRNYLSLCQSEESVYCLTAGLLVICLYVFLLVSLSTHVSLQFSSICLIYQLICVAIKMHLAASNGWPSQKWLQW